MITESIVMPRTGVTITTYLLDNSAVEPDRKRPLVLICPGGGYLHRVPHEGEPIALRLLASGIQAVIVKEDSAIKTVDDLYAEGAAFKVGVQQGTTGDIYSEGDFGAERVSKFNKGTDAVQALVTGKVDCVIIDNEPAKAYVAANNG